MRIQEYLSLRQVGKGDRIEYLLIPGEGAPVNFNKLISLNPSAAYLWENVAGKEFDLNTLGVLLVAKYDVDMDTALQDASALLTKWLDAGIVKL